MDTIPGDKFIADCARFIRYNEAKLGDVATRSTASTSGLNWMNPAAWLMPSASPPASAATGGTSARQHGAPPPPVVLHRPMPFRITSHHLYYILIRCESIGLPIGLLDVRIPARSRPSSYFAFISSNAAGATYRKRDLEETMSINSLQTTMSMFGLGASSSSAAGRSGATSWWSSDKHDVDADIKYIYSALTKIPALRIGPPPLKLVRDFEDCPGEMSVPLDALKNVQFLEFEDADPRAFLGWDRMSLQLRSLSMKRSGVEDVTDIIIDAVLSDARRRRGERVKPKQRKVHSSTKTDVSEATSSSAQTSDDAEKESERLPSLSWHFLRHLSLSDNSLTFLHPTPIACISNLTSLDLSSNLLNAVPPSLNLLPRLRSLNLSNNLIDSVLGIPDCIPHIHALNLSHNRLESLCGLERLSHLARVDLRHNEVFEAGEVGRLATLEHVVEVHVAGNPLMDEEEDPRVMIYREFAKEGRDVDALKLDDESLGYFERQRLRDAVPNMDRLRKMRGQTRTDTPSAAELAEPSKGNTAAHRTAAAAAMNGAIASSAAQARPAIAEEEAAAAEGSVVKSVRHRGSSHHRHQSGRMTADGKVGSNAGQTDVRSDAGATTESKLASNIVGQRRNRRVVKLTDSAHEAQEPHAVEESDSDLIKRAALAGDTDTAIGATVAAPPTSDSTTMTISSSTAAAKTGGDDDTGTQGTFTLRDQQSSASQIRSGGNNAATNAAAIKSAANEASSQELRRKIEALKGEVGDDWMRLLARGEST